MMIDNNNNNRSNSSNNNNSMEHSRRNVSIECNNLAQNKSNNSFNNKNSHNNNNTNNKENNNNNELHGRNNSNNSIRVEDVVSSTNNNSINIFHEYINNNSINNNSINNSIIFNQRAIKNEDTTNTGVNTTKTTTANTPVVYENTIVAQSDYHAALCAIETTFYEEAEKTFHLLKNNPQAQQLFQSIQNSLLQNLSSMVQPTKTDQAYHDIIDPYHFVEDDDDEYDEEYYKEFEEALAKEYEKEYNMEASNKENEDDDDDDDDEEEEIDEEDLLDTKAHLEAKRLRSNVRDLSKRIQQIQERTLNRARSFNPEKSSSILSSVDNQTDSSTGVVRHHHHHQQVIEAPTQEFDAMLNDENFQASLQQLSDLVNHPKWAKFSDTARKLQDTMDVIEKEQNRPLSQTEVAIISRNNSSSNEDDEELYGLLSQTTDQDEEMVTPEDRLFSFLQQFH